MVYPFMTLNDGTEITHTDIMLIDGKETVKVYIEQPVDGGFNSCECVLPGYKWTNIEGFNEVEIEHLKDIIKSTAHLIIRFARQGGLCHAANCFFE